MPKLTRGSTAALFASLVAFISWKAYQRNNAEERIEDGAAAEQSNSIFSKAKRFLLNIKAQAHFLLFNNPFINTAAKMLVVLRSWLDLEKKRVIATKDIYALIDMVLLKLASMLAAIIFRGKLKKLTYNIITRLLSITSIPYFTPIATAISAIGLAYLYNSEKYNTKQLGFIDFCTDSMSQVFNAASSFFIKNLYNPVAAIFAKGHQTSNSIGDCVNSYNNLVVDCNSLNEEIKQSQVMANRIYEKSPSAAEVAMVAPIAWFYGLSLPTSILAATLGIPAIKQATNTLRLRQTAS